MSNVWPENIEDASREASAYLPKCPLSRTQRTETRLDTKGSSAFDLSEQRGSSITLRKHNMMQCMELTIDQRNNLNLVRFPRLKCRFPRDEHSQAVEGLTSM